ncbi:hypothetical protein TBR22_A49490 [Luteitalea sp. TBR-22]|nr:hypothetical protein TBR22_A49490 [Luteitalea sp. TBR-22]
MKRGVPPTALKARTGLLTPPGIACLARANNLADLSFSVERVRGIRTNLTRRWRARGG